MRKLIKRVFTTGPAVAKACENNGGMARAVNKNGGTKEIPDMYKSCNGVT